MRIYYYAKSERTDVMQSHQQILDILQKTNIQLASNMLPDQGLDEDMVSSFSQSGLSLVSQFDGFILEVTDIDQQVSYFLAQAILQKKPTLCLYQKNRVPRQLLVFLKQKHIPNIIAIKAYSKENVAKAILDFLHPIESGVEEIEIPSIRFTLRLTPQLDRYLQFAIRGKKITKADYLREMLKIKSQNDLEYHKFLNKNID